ncbi:MAG: terpene cyclase/mutase family protein [Verrucomicrobia bacterium]|nr:terpene cyclase/mutase family protein [Verrucomicrobiota bacterium]
MHPDKHQDQQPSKPAGIKPLPGKIPRVAAPKSGKPRVVAKRRQPRVARRPLPPNFKPRFPDEVDFLTAQKPPPKWRTRYYAAAIVLHVALLTFLGYKMVYEPIMKKEPPPDLPAMKIAGDGLKPVGPENIPAPPAPPNRSLDKLVDAAPQVGPMPTVPRGITVPTHAPRSTPSLPVIALFNPKIPGNISAPRGVQGAAGAGNDPFVGRRSGSSRGGAVKRYGGSDASEAAVVKALKWLKKNQNTGQSEMGSWGSQYKVAMTGLALLAFLGHGETHESPEFEQTIKEALNFLATQSDQSQAPTSGYIGTARFEYQHPIAAYALCEDYALTRYAALKPVCEAAIALIINAQRPDGSWDYDYNTGPGGVYNLKNRPSGDSSISAWNVQALVAARNTGLTFPGLDDALRRSRSWFHAIYSREQGRFGYAVPDRMHSDALDGIGVLCLQQLGDGEAAEVKQTLPRLLTVETKFRAGNANSTYGWYYITQALFHAGGHWWAEWNTRLRDQLVENQDADGSWGSPGSAAWQDNMTSNKVKGKDSKVYHTTLMCLALEVYYRFLPTFNVFKTPPQGAPSAAAR